MRKETIKIKKELIVNLWNEKKASLSMQDIADIFRMSIGNVYKIIKAHREKKNQTDSNLSGFV